MHEDSMLLKEKARMRDVCVCMCMLYACLLVCLFAYMYVLEGEKREAQVDSMLPHFTTLMINFFSLFKPSRSITLY